MFQCKVCDQILGGSELHCDKENCPNRGWHLKNRPVWETILVYTETYMQRKYTVRIEYWQSRLRMQVAINDLIVIQTEAVDMMLRDPWDSFHTIKEA